MANTAPRALAKEVGRLTSWRQKIFGRRYQHIVVSNEEVEQVRRFRYVLSHGGDAKGPL